MNAEAIKRNDKLINHKRYIDPTDLRNSKQNDELINHKHINAQVIKRSEISKKKKKTK